MVGIETGHEARALLCRGCEKQRESVRVDIERHPAAAAHGIRQREPMASTLRPDLSEGGARLACVHILQRWPGQMMPLLIAVAMAIALLLAENF
jgi:hypothetical protein